MKTTFSSIEIREVLQFRNALHCCIFFLTIFLIGIDTGYSQSIARLNLVGSNDGNFHNSVSDDQGNIYYCTRDASNNSLNVTAMTKELVLLWSYNYNVTNIQPISGVNYKNGKIHITTDRSGDVAILVIDLMGNVLFSKLMSSASTTFTSTVMHDNNYVIATSYNTTNGSVQITRLTPAFATVFNKRIEFTNRDLIYIAHIKKIGNRIYFGGSSRTNDSPDDAFYWFFGALEMNGNLAFLNEYRVANNDQYPNNHLVSIDSVAPDLIITAAYTSDTKDVGGFSTYGDGLLVKVNSLTGAVIDHLIISPPKDEDWIFYLGMKYQANKIRVSGIQGVDQDFSNSGLLFGEIDLDFKNYKFKYSTSRAPNNRLTKFIDFDHISGSLSGTPIMMTAHGNGICKSTNECFTEVNMITLNREFIRIPNRYTLVDITYPITDLIVQRKPIQVSMTANCGAATCEDTHIIQICKSRYVYDYSAIQLNPNKVTNLTTNIANMTHDRINKKIIIDPLQSGTEIVLMETQINLFLKQLDTFKFVIISDSLPVLDLGPDRVLCNNGDSIVLSFGLDSIHWSNGSIGKSITVKSPGKYYGSYTNICGSVADTILITLDQTPRLILGDDALICGNQSVTLNSNYDNTIWSNGGRGRSIVVSTAGKITGFISTPCGTSFDTIEVFKFDKSSLTAGADQIICDPETNLSGSFINPNVKIYSPAIEWKQIDALPPVAFDDRFKLDPKASNLSKDVNHFFELNIRIGNSCIQKDTVKIFSQTCFIDSCAFIIEKNCLANGMVELRAIDANARTITPKARQREFFWDIKDGPAGKGYSVTNKNPVVVSNHTKYCLTSKIYSWPAGKPHTIEYAEICELESCDSLELNCTGPCEDFSFILSSCLDDYDEDYNLNFPAQFCRSVCINNCNYIVGIFDLDGDLIDPNFYTVKWSTGETGVASMQKGCFNYVLTVEVRRGDCVWYGRYRPSCTKYNGFSGNQTSMKSSGPENIDIQSIQMLLDNKNEFSIFDLYGRYVGKDEIVFSQLKAGLYFIRAKENGREVVRKVVVSGGENKRN